jgi:hypothetical protein
MMNTVDLNPVVADAQPNERIRARLLNMRQAAAYLGCSFWTARDYILQGLIPAVDMPPLRAREGDRQRKTLRRAGRSSRPGCVHRIAQASGRRTRELTEHGAGTPVAAAVA